MKAPDGNPDMGGVHMGASAAWLNGTGPVTEQAKFVVQSKKSIDQFIADKIAEDTPLRSLEVGTEDMGTSAGACDGYPCVFFNAISWRDDTSPLPVAVNPRVTFERMFGETGSATRRLAQHAPQAEPARLGGRGSRAACAAALGPADNAILDEYLTNIRDVEQQLDRMDARAAAVPEGAVAPLGLPDNIDDHLTVTYDLMLLAFQADISRVFTFMVGHEGSGRSYAHIGIPEPHHPVSHHGDTPEGIAKYAKLTTYHVAKLAEFVGKLQATRRRRRHAARSVADLLRQRHGQRQRPRSQQSARAADGRRQRPAEGQPPHRGGEEGADGQSAAGHGRPGGRRGRDDRPQHRAS